MTPFFISFVSDYKIPSGLKFYTVFLLLIFAQLSSNAQKTTFIDRDVDRYIPRFDFKVPEQSTVSISVPTGNGPKINSMLDSIFDANMRMKYMKGYKVLVYSGNDKDEAEKVKRRLYQLSLAPELTYKQPTYRIKVGDFTDRLDAKRFMAKVIIREYPKAIMIDDNVLIKRARE